MKTAIRRFFSLLLVLLMCMTIALTVFADSDGEITENYGAFRGQCLQNIKDPYILNTSTSVTRNANGAYLYMHVDFWSYGDSVYLDSFMSEAGDTLLARDLPLYYHIDFEPDLVFVEHHILDPVTKETLCELFTSEDIEFN